MRTRVKKHKLGSTKPASQLFLFSNRLSKNIDRYFSGNVVIEIELKSYDYKYHDEAKQVVDFMNLYCESRKIKPYRYLTVVLNYKPTGLTMAGLSGEYDYKIAVHGSVGYRQLLTTHSAYESLKKRLRLFDDYSHETLLYTYIAANDPMNLSKRTVSSLKNNLDKTEQSIHKSMSFVFDKFHKNFRPRSRR